MKILLINSFLYNRGGDCTYMFSLGELLNSKGHEVFYWGMKHPLNHSFKYQESFVDYNKHQMNTFFFSVIHYILSAFEQTTWVRKTTYIRLEFTDAINTTTKKYTKSKINNVI